MKESSSQRSCLESYWQRVMQPMIWFSTLFWEKYSVKIMQPVAIWSPFLLWKSHAAFYLVSNLIMTESCSLWSGPQSYYERIIQPAAIWCTILLWHVDATNNLVYNHILTESCKLSFNFQSYYELFAWLMILFPIVLCFSCALVQSYEVNQKFVIWSNLILKESTTY